MGTSTLIRNARTQSGLSQHELAARAHTSQSAIARYETGVTDPRASTLRRLLEVCGEQVAALPGPTKAQIPRKGPIGRLVDSQRDAIRQAGLRISDKPLYVFGSVARGQDTAASDLDILVELPEGSDVLAVYDLQSDLEDLLGVPVDVLSTRIARPDVLENARHDAVLL